MSEINDLLDQPIHSYGPDGRVLVRGNLSAADVAFHMPGKHDQRRHGKSGGWSAGQELRREHIVETINNDDSDAATAIAETMWGGAIRTADGSEYVSTVNEVYLGYEGLDVSGEIVDANTGDYVGSFQRRLVLGETATGDADITVEHSYFSINESMQGQGIGSEFYKNSEVSYRNYGVDQVTVDANIDVGGYAWAKEGYDFQDPGSGSSIGELLTQTAMGGQWSPSQRDSALGVAGRFSEPFGSDEYPLPFYAAMAGWSPGAETWPGKEAMIGSAWSGVKRLGPNSGRRPEGLSADVAFHLPGKHDQRRHAKGGRTAVTDGWESRDTSDAPEVAAAPLRETRGAGGGLSREFLDTPDAYWGTGAEDSYDGDPVDLPPSAIGTTAPPMSHAAGARSFLTQDESAAYFREEQSAWHGRLPDDYKRSATRYTNAEAGLWNSRLRERGDAGDPDAGLLAEATRSTVIPEDVILHRGISRQYGGKLPEFVEGSSFHDAGFQSTSAAHSAARDSEVVMRIRAPKGTRGADVSATSLFGDRESEILLPPGATYRIEKVHPGSGPVRNFLDVTLTHQGKRPAAEALAESREALDVANRFEAPIERLTLILPDPMFHMPGKHDQRKHARGGRGGFEALPRTERTDPASAVAGSNPGFPAEGRTTNCTNAITAYELRRRGYDVEAQPMEGNGRSLSEFVGKWRTPGGDPVVWENTPSRLMEENIGRLNPPGARGFASVNWRTGGGHVFAWEKEEGGKVSFMDPQKGLVDFPVSDYVSRARGHNAFHMRTDNATPDASVLGWVSPK